MILLAKNVFLGVQTRTRNNFERQDHHKWYWLIIKKHFDTDRQKSIFTVSRNTEKNFVSNKDKTEKAVKISLTSKMINRKIL